jgi:hypothetical protein
VYVENPLRQQKCFRVRTSQWILATLTATTATVKFKIAALKKEK